MNGVPKAGQKKPTFTRRKGGLDNLIPLPQVVMTINEKPRKPLPPGFLATLLSLDSPPEADSGPVALRHRIALGLAFSKTL